MFESNFSYKSSTALPPAVSLKDALGVLHDFEVVNRLNPDVRGAKPITPKNAPKRTTAAKPAIAGDTPLGDIQFFEVEDDLPFIPKRLWNGGVHYQADFVPTQQGCDITIHAPGGFTSVNHWRLVMDETKLRSQETSSTTLVADGAQAKSSDLTHTESDSGVWYVQIVSDAKCNVTFATFVKGFLKNSHAQLQRAFIEKCIDMKNAPPSTTRTRRPTIGRRRSSVF